MLPTDTKTCMMPQLPRLPRLHWTMHKCGIAYGCFCSAVHGWHSRHTPHLAFPGPLSSTILVHLACSVHSRLCPPSPLVMPLSITHGTRRWWAFPMLLFDMHTFAAWSLLHEHRVVVPFATIMVGQMVWTILGTTGHTFAQCVGRATPHPLPFHLPRTSA